MRGRQLWKLPLEGGSPDVVRYLGALMGTRS